MQKKRRANPGKKGPNTKEKVTKCELRERKKRGSRLHRQPEGNQKGGLKQLVNGRILLDQNQQLYAARGPEEGIQQIESKDAKPQKEKKKLT